MRTSNCLKIQPISVFLVSSKLALLHPLAFLKQGGSSQVLASGPFAVECHLEEVRLSTCRRLDKFSSLEQGKADRESVFSGLYLAANVWLLRRHSMAPSILIHTPAACFLMGSTAITQGCVCKAQKVQGDKRP